MIQLNRFGLIVVLALAGTAVQAATSLGAALSDTAPLTYYSVRPDTRKCVSPLCGGYFIKPVNHRAMACADGVRRAECYVAEIKWPAIGQPQDPDAALVLGQHRGQAYPHFGTLGILIPKAAWHAAGANPRPLDANGHVKGRWFGLRDTGVVCVTAPCFNIKERVLNRQRASLISGVDLGKVDADPDDRKTAMHLLRDSELIAVGKNVRVRKVGPAGDGIVMVAYDFYLPVKSRGDDPLYCEVDADCTASAFHSLVRSAKECYCPLCPEPLGVAAAKENEASWRKYCSDFNNNTAQEADPSGVIRPEPLTCPLAPCRWPNEVACVKNQCVRLEPQPVDYFSR